MDRRFIQRQQGPAKILGICAKRDLVISACLLFGQ